MLLKADHKAMRKKHRAEDRSEREAREYFAAGYSPPIGEAHLSERHRSDY
jgi:hypothetical protein